MIFLFILFAWRRLLMLLFTTYLSRQLATTGAVMLTSTSRKFFFLGLNTGFVSDGLPDGRCCDFYARRSGNGL